MFPSQEIIPISCAIISIHKCDVLNFKNLSSHFLECGWTAEKSNTQIWKFLLPGQTQEMILDDTWIGKINLIINRRNQFLWQKDDLILLIEASEDSCGESQGRRGEDLWRGHHVYMDKSCKGDHTSCLHFANSSCAVLPKIPSHTEMVVVERNRQNV